MSIAAIYHEDWCSTHVGRPTCNCFATDEYEVATDVLQPPAAAVLNRLIDRLAGAHITALREAGYLVVKEVGGVGFGCSVVSEGFYSKAETVLVATESPTGEARLVLLSSGGKVRVVNAASYRRVSG